MNKYKDLYSFFVDNLEDTVYNEDTEEQGRYLHDAYNEASQTAADAIDHITEAFAGQTVATALEENGADFCLDYLHSAPKNDTDENAEKKTSDIIAAWTCLSNEERTEVNKALLAMTGYEMESSLNMAEERVSSKPVQPDTYNIANTL